MNIGVFTDKNHHPTDDEIFNIIGNRITLWTDVIRFISDNYSAVEDFKFLYGKKYGWALRFLLRGKLFTSLYPTEGGFTVQINLSPDAVEQALRMNPGKNVQDAIARANPYPEGRWLFIPVESEDDIRDIKQLLALRSGTSQLA